MPDPTLKTPASRSGRRIQDKETGKVLTEGEMLQKGATQKEIDEMLSSGMVEDVTDAEAEVPKKKASAPDSSNYSDLSAYTGAGTQQVDTPSAPSPGAGPRPAAAAPEGEETPFDPSQTLPSSPEAVPLGKAPATSQVQNPAADTTTTTPTPKPPATPGESKSAWGSFTGYLKELYQGLKSDITELPFEDAVKAAKGLDPEAEQRRIKSLADRTTAQMATDSKTYFTVERPGKQANLPAGVRKNWITPFNTDPFGTHDDPADDSKYTYVNEKALDNLLKTVTDPSGKPVTDDDRQDVRNRILSNVEKGRQMYDADQAARRNYKLKPDPIVEPKPDPGFFKMAAGASAPVTMVGGMGNQPDLNAPPVETSGGMPKQLTTPDQFVKAPHPDTRSAFQLQVDYLDDLKAGRIPNEQPDPVDPKTMLVDAAGKRTDAVTVATGNVKSVLGSKQMKAGEFLTTQLFDLKQTELQHKVASGQLTADEATAVAQKYQVELQGNLEQYIKNKVRDLNKQAGIPRVYQAEIDHLEQNLKQMESEANQPFFDQQGDKRKNFVSAPVPKVPDTQEYRDTVARIAQLKGLQASGDYDVDQDSNWDRAMQAGYKEMMIQKNENLKEAFNNMGMTGEYMDPDAYLRTPRNFMAKQLQGLFYGIGNIEAMSGAALNYLGHYGAGNKLTKQGQDYAKANDLPMQIDENGEQTVIDDDIPTWIARNVSAQIPLVAALGGTANISGAAAKGFLEGYGVFKKVSPFMEGAMGGLIEAVPESLMEGADAYNQYTSEGNSVAAAKRKAESVFHHNLVMTGLLNPLEYGLMKMPINGKLGSIMHGSLEAGLNGGQEIIQNWIQQRQTDPNLSLWEYAKSPEGLSTGLAGMAMGVMQSTIMGKFQDMSIRKHTDDLLSFGMQYDPVTKSFNPLPGNETIARTVLRSFMMKDSYKRADQLKKTIDRLEAAGTYDSGEAARVKAIIDDVAAVKSQIPTYGSDEQQLAVFNELLQIHTNNKYAKQSGTKTLADAALARNAPSEERIKRIMQNKEPLYFINGHEMTKDGLHQTVDALNKRGLLGGPTVQISVANDAATEAAISDKIKAAQKQFKKDNPGWARRQATKVADKFKKSPVSPTDGEVEMPDSEEDDSPIGSAQKGGPGVVETPFDHGTESELEAEKEVGTEVKPGSDPIQQTVTNPAPAADETEVNRRKKLNGWPASYELATIAKSEGVDLSKMTREDYADYAIKHHLAIDDTQLRASPDQRMATSVQEVGELFKKNTAAIDPKLDNEYGVWADKMKDDAGTKPQSERYLSAEVRLMSGTAKSNSWLHFFINDGTDDQAEDTHKAYFSFRDLNQFSIEEFKGFMAALQAKGYNGQVKIFQDISQQATRLSDQVVMHGKTEADARMAADFAREYYGDKLLHQSMGKDSKGQSYSQILATRIRNEIDKGTPKQEAPKPEAPKQETKTEPVTDSKTESKTEPVTDSKTEVVKEYSTPDDEVTMYGKPEHELSRKVKDLNQDYEDKSERPDGEADMDKFASQVSGLLKAQFQKAGLDPEGVTDEVTLRLLGEIYDSNGGGKNAEKTGREVLQKFVDDQAAKAKKKPAATTEVKTDSETEVKTDSKTGSKKPVRTEPYKDGDTVEFFHHGTKKKGKIVSVPGFENMDFVEVSDGISRIHDLATGQQVKDSEGATTEKAIDNARKAMEAGKVTREKIYDQIVTAEETGGNLGFIANNKEISPKYQAYKKELAEKQSQKPDFYTEDEKKALQLVMREATDKLGAEDPLTKRFSSWVDAAMTRKADPLNTTLSPKMNPEQMRRQIAERVPEKTSQERVQAGEPLDPGQRKKYDTSYESFVEWANEGRKRKDQLKNIDPKTVQAWYQAYVKMQTINNKYGYQRYKDFGDLFYKIHHYKLNRSKGDSKKAAQALKESSTIQDAIDATYNKEFGTDLVEMDKLPTDTADSGKKPTGSTKDSTKSKNTIDPRTSVNVPKEILRRRDRNNMDWVKVEATIEKIAGKDIGHYSKDIRESARAFESGVRLVMEELNLSEEDVKKMVERGGASKTADTLAHGIVEAIGKSEKGSTSDSKNDSKNESKSASETKDTAPPIVEPPISPARAKLLEELAQKKEAFRKASIEARSGLNMNINVGKSAKWIATGIDLLGTFSKLGIIKFKEVTESMIETYGKKFMDSHAVEGLRRAYAAFRSEQPRTAVEESGDTPRIPARNEYDTDDEIEDFITDVLPSMLLEDQSDTGAEDDDDEEVYQRKLKEKQALEQGDRFQPGDMLMLHSPHTPDLVTEVSFRGYLNNEKDAVIWDQKNGSQFTVPAEWLRRPGSKKEARPAAKKEIVLGASKQVYKHIGENAQGDYLYENEEGFRAIDNGEGAYTTEPVAIVQKKDGIKYGRSDARKGEYMTLGEIDRRSRERKYTDTALDKIAAAFKKRFGTDVEVVSKAQAQAILEEQGRQFFFQLLDEVDLFTDMDRTKVQAFIDKVFTTVKDSEEAKKAYRKLAIKYHPDKAGSHEIMQDINNAYDAYKARTFRPGAKGEAGASAASGGRSRPTANSYDDPYGAAAEWMKRQKAKADEAQREYERQQRKQQQAADELRKKRASQPDPAETRRVKEQKLADARAARDQKLSDLTKWHTSRTQQSRQQLHAEIARYSKDPIGNRDKIFDARMQERARQAEYDQDLRAERQQIENEYRQKVIEADDTFSNSRFQFQKTGDQIPAGFYDPITNKAYLVEGIADDTTPIHEMFSHPFIEAVERANPQLFKNLLNAAAMDTDIMQYVSDHYGVDIPDKLFAHEIIARAIDLEAKNQLKDKNLIEHIKKFWNTVTDVFKSMFGGKPSRIENINADTKISDIVKFLLESGESLNLAVQAKEKETRPADAGPEMKSFYNASGHTKADESPTGSKAPERNFKADLSKFSRALSAQLGWEQPLYPKGSKNPGRPMHAMTEMSTIGGAGIITLFKPGTSYGVTIRVPVRRIVDENGNEGLQISNDVEYRVATRDDQFQGAPLTLGLLNFTVADMSEKMEILLDPYQPDQNQDDDTNTEGRDSASSLTDGETENELDGRTSTGSAETSLSGGDLKIVPGPGSGEGSGGATGTDGKGSSKNGGGRGGKRTNTGANGSGTKTGASNGTGGTGRNTRQFTRRVTPEKQSDRNHVIEPADTIIPEGVPAKATANMNAILLLRQLESENRNPTPEEKKVLAQFTGWGGIAGYLKDRTADAVAENIISKIIRGGKLTHGSVTLDLPPMDTAGKSFHEIALAAQAAYEKILKENDMLEAWVNDEHSIKIPLDQARIYAIKALLSAAEHRTAVNSTLTSYYTDRGVIQKMWGAARRLGFEGGAVLESSAGVGHFFGLMPQDIAAQTNLTGVELDDLAGRILTKLYPESSILAKGFEEVNLRPGSQDLVIGNVPFGDAGLLTDPNNPDIDKWNIHNYFIAKNLKLLKPGGIAILITTNRTMDAAGSVAARRWFGSVSGGNSDLVGAIRLPNNAFDKGAGTQVTSDILIFQKRKGENVQHDNPIVTTQNIKSEIRDGEVREIDINEYYIAHPENMIGEMMFAHDAGSGGLYGKYAPTLQAAPGTDVQGRVEEIFNTLPADVMNTDFDATGGADTVINTTEREGRLYEQDGELYISEGDSAVVAHIRGTPLSPARKAAALQYLKVRETLAQLTENEMSEDSTDEEIEQARRGLNYEYDRFKDAHGALDSNGFLYDLDNDYSLVSTIENVIPVVKVRESDGKVQRTFQTEKADILKQRVNFPRTEPKTAENLDDAINISMAYRNQLSDDYLAKLLNKTVEEVRQQLIDEKKAYEDPATGLMVTPPMYLSGDVREKLRVATAAASADARFYRNVYDLTDVLPADIPASQANFRMGVGYLPASLYKSFFWDLLGVNTKVGYIQASGKWSIEVTSGEEDTLNTSSFAVGDVTGMDIAMDVMNFKQTKIKMEGPKDAKGNREKIVDEAATAQAEEMQQTIMDRFVEFVRDNEEYAKILEEQYNKHMNSIVETEYPIPYFDHFPGQAKTINGKDFKMRLHQKRAVVRSLSRNTLYAHSVGTGKTITIITAAMEMRRLGTARKPMIVVKNATLGAFTRTFMQLYPGARLLVPNERDMSAAGRKRFFGRIATGNYDAIIIPQSQIDLMPDDPVRVEAYLQERMDEIEAQMNNLTGDEPPYFKKDLEREKDKIKKEVDKLYEEEYELDEKGDIKIDPKTGMPKKLTKDQKAANRAEEQAERDDAKDKAETKSAKTEAEANLRAEAHVDRQARRRTDKIQYFDSFGVDALFVDESHAYKKLGFSTSIDGVKGIDVARSQKSLGILLKTRSVMDRTGGKNIVFSTGTPITNTMAEAWTNLRYLAPDMLKSMGIEYFDQFVNNFATAISSLEMDPGGKARIVNRLAKFYNLPELLKAFRSVADVVTTDDIPEFKEDPDLAPPKMKNESAQFLNGRPTMVFVPLSQPLAVMIRTLNRRYQQWKRMRPMDRRINRHWPVQLVEIGKIAAIDVRLIDPTAPDDPDSKVNTIVRHALELYKEYGAQKATQMIFSDNQTSTRSDLWRGLAGTSQASYTAPLFNVFEDIKKKLIAGGVPASEIAIASEAKDTEAIEKMAIDMNDGTVRFMLGSSEKMGVGINAQERMIALHHLDAPKRPDLWTQRNGRILRQGNIFAKLGIPVDIRGYGIKGSRDSTIYDRLRYKDAFITDFMKGRFKDRESDDEAGEEIDAPDEYFGEFSALLSGSKARLDLEVVKGKLRREVNREKAFVARIKDAFKRLRDKRASLITLGDEIETSKRITEAKQKFFPLDKVDKVEIAGETYTQKWYEPLDQEIKKGIAVMAPSIEEMAVMSYQERQNIPVFYEIKVKVNGTDAVLQMSRPSVNRSTGDEEVAISAQLRVPDLGIRKSMGKPTAASMFATLRNELDRVQGASGYTQQQYNNAVRDIANLEKDVKLTFDRTKLDSLESQVVKLTEQILEESRQEELLEQQDGTGQNEDYVPGDEETDEFYNQHTGEDARQEGPPETKEQSEQRQVGLLPPPPIKAFVVLGDGYSGYKRVFFKISDRISFPGLTRAFNLGKAGDTWYVVDAATGVILTKDRYEKKAIAAATRRLEGRTDSEVEKSVEKYRKDILAGDPDFYRDSETSAATQQDTGDDGNDNRDDEDSSWDNEDIDGEIRRTKEDPSGYETGSGPAAAIMALPKLTKLAYLYLRKGVKTVTQFAKEVGQRMSARVVSAFNTAKWRLKTKMGYRGPVMPAMSTPGSGTGSTSGSTTGPGLRARLAAKRRQVMAEADKMREDYAPRFFNDQELDENMRGDPNFMNFLNWIQDKTVVEGRKKVGRGLQKLTEQAMQKQIGRVGKINRFLGKVANGVLANLGKSAEDVTRGDMMTGETRVRSIADAVKIFELLRRLVRNSPESLGRINQLLDPEFYQERTRLEWDEMMLNELQGDTDAFNLIPTKQLDNSYEAYRKKFGFDDPGYKMTEVADLTPEEKLVYDHIRFLYDMMHKINFSIGKLTLDVYEANEGKYSARLYDEYEIPEDVEKEMKKTGALTMEESLYMKRGDLTHWKLLNGLADPVYSASKRLSQTLSNKAIYDYSDYLLHHKKDATSKVPKEGYRKMGWGYGKLSGKYLRDDIAEDFVGHFFSVAWQQKFFEAMKAYDQWDVRQGYKKILTVAQPAVHGGNILGNWNFGWLVGVNAVRLNANVPFARQQKEAYSAMYRYLLSQHVIGSDITQADLYQGGKSKLVAPKGTPTGPKTPPPPATGGLTTFGPTGAEIKKVYEAGKEKLQPFMQAVQDFYSGVDEVYKIAAFKSLLDLGYTAKEAADRVKQGFQNYRRVGKLYSLFSKIPVVGQPFGTFAGDLFRILRTGMTDRPLNTMAAMALFKGLSYFFSKFVSGETDDQRRKREMRAGAPMIPFLDMLQGTDYAFLGGNIPLEWKIGGSTYNLARLLSPAFLYSNAAGDESWEFAQKFSPMPLEWPDWTRNPGGIYAVGAAQNVNDPVWAPVIQMLLNSDFRGVPIADPKQTKYQEESDLTTTEKNYNRLRYLWRGYVPYGSSIDDFIQAVEGDKDYYDRKKSPAQVIMSFLGVKSSEFSDQKYQEVMDYKMNGFGIQFRDQAEVIGQAKKKLKNGEITKDKYEERIAPHLQRQAEIASEAADTLEKLTGDKTGHFDLTKDNVIEGTNDKRERETKPGRGDGLRPLPSLRGLRPMRR